MPRWTIDSPRTIDLGDVAALRVRVVSGSVAILALMYGPLVLCGYVLVAALGWSRVALADHTVAQVVAGSVLGAAAAVLAYAALAR